MRPYMIYESCPLGRGDGGAETKNIIMIEGLHVLSDENLRELLDIKVFVDTDPDVWILRRVLRDIEERGRTISPSTTST